MSTNGDHFLCLDLSNYNLPHLRFTSLATAVVAVPFQSDIRVEDADHLLKSLDLEEINSALAGLVAEQVQNFVHCFVLYFGFLYYGSILIGGFIF